MRTKTIAFVGLVVGALLVAGCGFTGQQGAVNVTPSPAGTTARVVDATLRTADGKERSYRLFLPSALNSPDAEPLPLLIALHGGVGSGIQYESNSGFDVIAAKEQVIIAYPDGVGAAGTGALRTWNGGGCCGPAATNNVDDVAFISQLIDTIESQFPVDRHRVYAAGHSNGGILSYRLACELSDKIVAIGVQSATLMVSPCDPAQPVSVIDIQGSGDKNVPINGGKGEGISNAVFPAPITAVTTLAKADGCPAASTTTVDPTNADVTTKTWQPCKALSGVGYVVVAGASHAWMGHGGGAPALTGPPYMNFDSSAAIWAFLAAHPRP